MMRGKWRGRKAVWVGFVSLVSSAVLSIALASPASASVGVCVAIFHISGTLPGNTNGGPAAIFQFGYQPIVLSGIYNDDPGYAIWPSYVQQFGNNVYVGFIYNTAVTQNYSGNAVVEYQC